MITHVIRPAARLWWHHIVHMTFLNCAWFVLQIPILTGPPATATLYALTHRMAEGHFVTMGDMWRTMRQMFVPAWKWGITNGLVAIAVGGNFWLARNQAGDIWTILRLFWAAVAVIWVAINMFYWPLWLAQSDQSVRNTLRNGLVLLLRAPGQVLLITFFCLAIAILSMMALIPLVNWLMVWVACIGLFASEDIIKKIRETP